MPINITPGVVFSLLDDVRTSMTKNGIMDASGAFVKSNVALTIEEVTLVVADLEATLKAQGLVVPPKIDKLIAAAPGIGQLLTMMSGS